MKVQDAIYNVDQVCIAFKGTRHEHEALSRSIDIIKKELVFDNKKKEAAEIKKIIKKESNKGK